MDINNKTFFCSWSGGKDSCLSLYYAIRQGGIPQKLITMLVENGERSRAHGLSKDALKKQSEALNIPLGTYATSMENYEKNFIKVMKEAGESGISLGVFGDIDLEEHLLWIKRVCDTAGMGVYHPLWKKSRRKVVDEFIEYGFKAVIVAVKENMMGKEYLGREINKALIDELEKAGVDPAGENGEYHTLVTGGPIFTKDIEYKLDGEFNSNGHWFQKVVVY
ncbi:MAG TPA: diphthine--ammonia ligase [Clostridia bacterium]|nr:diphthine--ammonia ligase [Clostridia bacterium]